MTVRVAILGAGVMGADHARIIAKEVPGARLHVLCDASPARARAVGEACDAVDILTDPIAAATHEDVDAVIIASPDDTHRDLTLVAMAAGKPVLCEKPLAPTPRACLEVIAAEVALGHRRITCAFMRRYDQSYSELKSVLDSGALGRAMVMHNFHRNVSAPNGFTASMAITNSAPHEFDIARYVLGAEFRAVTAFESARSDGAIPPVVMTLETTAGQIVTVEVNNNAAYGYDVRAELVGETGSVDLGTPARATCNLGLKASQTFDVDWRPRFADAYRRQNSAWINAIATGAQDATAATAWDGYCASLVAEAGVAALRTGRRTAILPADKPALYATDQGEDQNR